MALTDTFSYLPSLHRLENCVQPGVQMSLSGGGIVKPPGGVRCFPTPEYSTVKQSSLARQMQILTPKN